MGGHYGSVQVRSDRRQTVIDAAAEVMRERHIRCLVGPVLDGWIGVYPENGGQDQTIGEAMAAQLGGEVLHLLVHDEDVMAYWYWHDGKLADSFWSKPGYFGEEDRVQQEAMVGQSEVLGCLTSGKDAELRKLLQRNGDGFTFESERLERFAKLLGIANAVTAYEYLKGGETKEIREWKQFVELPTREIAKEKKDRRAQRKQTNALIKQFQSDGLLLSYASKKDSIPRAAVAKDGFVVAWETMLGQQRHVEQCGPPWTTARSLTIDVSPQVNAITRDSTGESVAMALGNRVVVWSTANWRPTLEVAESDWAITVALSADGRMLAHGSRQELVVTDTGTGRRLVTYPTQQHHGMAWHPSGRWLVVPGPVLAIAMVGGDERPRWHELCVGGKVETPEVATELLQRQLAPVDIEKAEQKARAALEDTLNLLQSMVKLGDQQLARMRKEMEKQWEKSRASLLAAKERRRTEPLQGAERVATVGFSADGRWLWCGTDKGLRVYAWDDVTATDGDEMPPAKWHFDPPGAAEPWRSGYIYAATEVQNHNELVFGGVSGKLYRMDLRSGAVQELMTLPEAEPILSIHLSQDQVVLGVASRVGMFRERGKRDERGVWSLWSYPAIRGREELQSGVRGGKDGHD